MNKALVNVSLPQNSRGFNVGDRIQVLADANLPKKLSYARCCVGVVTHIGKFVTVQLEATNNFETHFYLVKPECLQHWPGRTSVAELALVSPMPDASIQSLTSSVPATKTTIAKISCSSDTQEPSVSKTFNCGHQLAKYQQLSLLPPAPLVSPSPFRESDWALKTRETVSPQLSERSPSTLVTCPSCAEPLLRLEDGCGVCGWLPSKRKRSPNKRPASGSLGQKRFGRGFQNGDY